MSTIVARPAGTLDTEDSRLRWGLKSAAGWLGRCRQEFAIVKDRRIYADFFGSSYQRNNISRLQHLESLELDIKQKSVLELGAGIGDHSLFYLYRNCRLLPVEGRPKLAKKLSERLGIAAQIVDLDREPEKLEQFGRFDLVHCYGLLYHLSDPARLLSSVSHVGNCLLLETCVSFGVEPTINKCKEPSSVPSQALHGQGCRPTREWIFNELKSHFGHVYVTRTQPRHPEFPTDWTKVSTEVNTLLKRAVFVASHKPICNPNLLPELPQKQVHW